ncbi:unnamed protein product, partial [Symbiodinium natans]
PGSGVSHSPKMGAGASAQDLAAVDDATLVGVIATDPDRIERLLRTARQQPSSGASKTEAQDYGIAFSSGSSEPDCKWESVKSEIQSRSWQVSGSWAVRQFRYRVRGDPHDSEGKSPFEHANSYSMHRAFHPLLLGSRAAVVWQNRIGWEPVLSIFGDDFCSHEQVTLPSAEHATLAGAAHDGKDPGALFLLMVQWGDGRPAEKRCLTVIKAAVDGTELKREVLDGGEDGLNMVLFGHYDDQTQTQPPLYGAQLSVACAGGQLGVCMARFMHRSDDGLNHQGGIWFTLSADTLQFQQRPVRTSSHSLDSAVTTSLDRHGYPEFLCCDLGDAYPRGLHLHRFVNRAFGGGGNQGLVVYSYKCRHGEAPKNDAGMEFEAYETLNATAGGQENAPTYYKWSNDNACYTELGGVVSVGNSIAVAFAGEGSPHLDCLSSAPFASVPTERHRITPRNLGIVSVRKNMEGPGGEVWTTKSDYSHKGGFYAFRGEWQEQAVQNVCWLTDLKGDANVSRLRACALGSQVLLLWELWSRSYITTCAQCVDEKGEPVSEVLNLGTQIRLGRRTEPLATAKGDVIIVQRHDGPDGPELEVSVLSTGIASQATEEQDVEVTAEELAAGGKRKFKFARMTLCLKAVLEYCREANGGKDTWQSGTLGEVTWEEACQHAFAHSNFVDVIFDPDGFTKETPMLKVRLPVYLKGDTNSCISTFTVVPTGKKKVVDYSKAAEKKGAGKKKSPR